MQHNGWDHALKVTADGRAWSATPGRCCCARWPTRSGLTAALGSALLKDGQVPLVDRGIALVSMAVAIVLGATSMSDIALLAHLAPLLGAAPSGPTVRRALDLADPRACWTGSPGPGRGPGARLDADRADAGAGSRGWPSPGRCWTGWLVIDMDATLVTAH